MYRPKEHVGLARVCGIVALLALMLGSFALGAGAQTLAKAPVSVAAESGKTDSFAPRTRVVLFSSSGAGQWALATFGQAKPGSEFYFNDQLYRVVGSDKARVVPFIDADKLFEADRPYDANSRRPQGSDVVQVLDKDLRPVSHAFYSALKPSVTIRFQGRAYRIMPQGIATVFSAATSTLQRITITKSALQHIADRHTARGSMNAGKSTFNSGEDIQRLIRNAQLLTPIPQAGGNSMRVFDAGRNIGVDRATGKRTSTYTVITTDTGRLVTAFPGLP